MRFGSLFMAGRSQQKREMPMPTLGGKGRRDHRLSLRQGRAIGWFEDALAPLVPAMGESGVHRLAVAVRSAVGIESLVWLTDIAGLSRDQASEVMQWSARTMLHQALADGRPDAR
jgi:hypothetical protein